jgi:signal transduction histidine kinase
MAPNISEHRFICQFPVSQRTKLAEHVQLVRFPAQAVIFDEDTVSDCIYLIFAGQVALTKKSPGGAPQIIAHKGPNDYFGELGVLESSSRSTAAIADGPVHLGCIRQKPFLDLLSESPWQTVLQLFSHISENLRETNTRYVTEVVRKEKITLIGEMANTMIHDFRGPFSVIQMGAELLAQRESDPKTQHVCAMILRQITRLTSMVEEVLEFSRGETRLKVRPVPLREVFDQLRENNAGASARSGVQLLIQPSPLVLLLDPDRFQRLLQNLVTNAHEALGQNTNGCIRVAARRHQDQCRLTIADNGPGIPREIRSTLFDPFVSHGKSGGTGLGLALVRSVVEAHHGSISFRSTRAGTTFSLQLPLAPS